MSAIGDWHATVLSGEWKLVSSIVEPDVEPVTDVRHARWSARGSHDHPAMEVLVPIEGNGRYGWAGRTYPARPGTLFFIDSTEPHDNGYPQWCPRMSHLWIALAENHVFAQPLALWRGKELEIGAQVIVNLEDHGLDVARAVADCRALKSSQPDLARRMLVSALDAVLCRVVERDRRGRDGSAADFTPASVIETIRLHVRATGGRGATIAHLAKMAGYSRFHFLRLFREHTGRTVHEYVDECRVDRTLELLRDGIKLGRISSELGFSCPAAFSRWWRSHRSMMKSAEDFMGVRRRRTP
jgi:AraC-like DNA-binding protein